MSIRPGHFFLKIFLLAVLFYACSNKRTGPYAQIQLMVGSTTSFLRPIDTGQQSQASETARLRNEIFSLKLLEETLHSFQTDFTPQELRENMENEVLENTNIVQIRFYCEKEGFSCAFLDSLAKHYRLYREALLKQENDRQMAGMVRELEVIKDSVLLYEDSLLELRKNLPPPKQTYSREFIELQKAETVLIAYQKTYALVQQGNFKPALVLWEGSDNKFLQQALLDLAENKEGKTSRKDVEQYLKNMIEASKYTLEDAQRSALQEKSKTINNPDELRCMKLESKLRLFESTYTSLMEEKVKVSIQSAGTIYSLEVLGPACYIVPESKKF